MKLAMVLAPDYLDKLLCYLQCFFFKDQGKKYGSVFQPDTASSFQKSPALYWQAKTYSALSFDH